MNNNELDLDDLFSDLFESFWDTKANVAAAPSRISQDRPVPQTLEDSIDVAKGMVLSLDPNLYNEDQISYGFYAEEVDRVSKSLLNLLNQMKNQSSKVDPLANSKLRELEYKLSNSERELASLGRQHSDVQMQLRLLQSEKTKELERERKRHQDETKAMREKLAELERVRKTVGDKRAVVNLSHITTER